MRDGLTFATFVAHREFQFFRSRSLRRTFAYFTLHLARHCQS